MNIRIAATALCLVFSAGIACAGDWVKLGERSVNLIAERDEIPVTAIRGKFSKIQIRVEESGVEFRELVVVLGNGRKIDVPVRNLIPAGGRTREIDLPGQARNIRKVIMEYKTQPGNARRARVEVWGREN